MGWFKRYRLAFVGALPIIWQFTRWALDAAGNIDLVVSRAQDPGWVKAVWEFLVYPPEWLPVLLIVAGLALIFWDLRRGRRSTLRLDTNVGHPKISVTTPVPPRRQIARVADLRKVAVFDKLYPKLYDLSEVCVDQLGNKSGRWREDFLNGNAVGFMEMMHAEIRIVVDSFSTIRDLINRHKIYEDIYLMENEIAARINAVPECLGVVRQFSEKLSNRFDDKSIGLVEEDMKATQVSIGKLRTYLSRDCMGRLVELRREEMAHMM